MKGEGWYYRLLSSLYLSTFVVRASFAISFIIFPLYLKQAGVTSYLGYALVLSLSPMLELISVLGFGAWIDKYGRKRVLVGGAVLSAVALSLFAVSDKALPVAVFNGMHGISAAAILVSSLALITDYAAHSNRGREMGMFEFIQIFGWFAGFAIGGVLAEVFSGHLEYAFLVGAGMGAFGAVYAVINVTEPEKRAHLADQLGLQHLMSVLRQRAVILLILPWILIYILISSVLTFASKAGFEEAKLTGFQLAGILGGGGGVLLVTFVFFGRLSDKYGRMPIMIVGTIGMVGVMLTAGAGVEVLEDAPSVYVDQRFEGSYPHNLGQEMEPIFDQSLAQTFRPGMNGKLESIDLLLGIESYSNDTPMDGIIEVRQVDGAGMPSNVSLFAQAFNFTSLDGTGPVWVGFKVTNTTVSVNKHYAIVVSIRHGYPGNIGQWYGSFAEGYPGGEALATGDSDGLIHWRPLTSASNGSVDLGFRTHVSPSGLSGALKRGGTPLKLLIVPGAAFGFMAGAFGPAALASLADVSHQKRRGMTMGLYSFVISAAMTVGPIMSGAIIDNYGGKGVLVFMTACALLMMVFVLIRWYDARLEARRAPPPATAEAPPAVGAPPGAEGRQGPGPSP